MLIAALLAVAFAVAARHYRREGPLVAGYLWVCCGLWVVFLIYGVGFLVGG